jgi:cytidylate kinase
MKNLKGKAYNQHNRFVIALDGSSASGKGSIGRMLASEFNLKYVQSGIFYRSLAYLCMINNIDVTYLKKIIELSKTDNLIELTKGVDLNQENIGNYTSQISTIPEVRASINKYLILMIETYPRILMEGRDIGTVIAKDADLKIFITADVNKRAERRYKQLHEEGKKCTLEDVLQLLKERDLRDSTRIADPLAIASDAFVIDTSYMNQDQVIANIKNYIELS